MEANSKHDFNATAEDELSFRKGQVLKVNQAMMLSSEFKEFALQNYMLICFFNPNVDS
jgi:hypothetical protein